MAKITKDVWRGAQMRILTDMRGLKSITKEARRFSSQNNARFKDNIAANAMLVGNPISTTLGNIILRVDHPPFPTKLFTNSDDATSWLSDFKKKVS